jgi:putative heme transporter
MADDQPRWFRRLDRWAAVAWRFLAVIVAIAVAAWLLAQLSIILMPSIFALFICTVLIPVRNAFVRIHLPQTVASLLAVLTGFLAIGLVILAIIPPVVDEWDDLVDSVERAYDDIFDWLEDGPIGLSADQVENLRDNIESAQDAILENLASGALAGIPVVIEVLIGIVLAVVVAFYFLRDGERLWEWIVARLPEAEHQRAQEAGRKAWRTLSRYLRGMTFVAFVDAVGIGIGAYVLDLPLVVPIAVVTFLTAFIPIVGAIAAGAVAVLIALADGGPTTALWMLLVVLVVQQVESNVVAPVVVGRAMEIHPLVVLLGVTGGGAIAGVLGALFATPIIAVANVLIRELLGGDEPSAEARSGTQPGSAGEAPG